MPKSISQATRPPPARDIPRLTPVRDSEALAGPSNYARINTVFEEPALPWYNPEDDCDHLRPSHRRAAAPAYRAHDFNVNGDHELNVERGGFCSTSHVIGTKLLEKDDSISSPPDYESHGDTVSTPALNIVIQIVGSRGDVQPFVALGCALQQQGHRVRLATHSIFTDFVINHGLEFFSIGGDPAELMAYMVKNPGLMPKFATLRSGEVQKRRRVMFEIMNGCWRSCIEDGGESPTEEDRTLSQQGAKGSKPFVADAIIANPPSFAHIHCAERLGIPLHLMFTMPWSPTEQFPHPLTNIRSSGTEARVANYLSYLLVDMMTWQGLGDVIGQFRRKTLNLEPVDPTWAPLMLTSLKIPHTYCWSPKLIPKPQDWASHIKVAGFFFLVNPVQYTPPPALEDFLASGPPPVYIGFGSIVVDDPSALTMLLYTAIHMCGERALISKGWGGIGTDSAVNLPPGVFLLSDCPHEWLFPKVSCVVHHGGAGTTAAAIAAGKPSVVVPFFGDQPFWGNKIHQTGAGTRPIPFAQLSADALAEAIRASLKPEVAQQARELGEQVREENGLQTAIENFTAHLPMGMRCDFMPGRAAAWRLRTGGKTLRLSLLAATVLRKAGFIDFNKLKIHQTSRYDVNRGPWDPISGSTLSILDLFQETFKGIGEIGSEFTHIPRFDYKSKGKAKGNVVVETCQLQVNDAQNQLPAGTDTDEKLLPTSSQISSVRDVPGQQPLYAQLQRDASERKIVGVRAAKGLGRIVKAAMRSPMTFTISMAKGSDNVMKLLGDKTVRPQPEITGVGSGLAAAGKGFALNTYDGLAGLVMQPVNGAIDNGMIGGVAGLARGVIGLPLKWWSGSNELVGYALKGVDTQLKGLGKPDVMGRVRWSKMAQGEWEYAEARQEDIKAVLEAWEKMDP